ncbi:Rho termination factor [Nocardioidaceae bacterium]|nr:Rho termination factor [Nocardioidaceae bacterium]
MASDNTPDHGPSVKDDEFYEELREEGKSKSTAAAIANAAADESREEVGRRGGKQPAYEEWSKDELYERAQELDVDGRSDMSKDELIEALRDQ